MPFDPRLTLEQLEGEKWSPPAPHSTTLERSVADLRGRPVDSLSAWELARLIGQKIGLKFLVPYALERLLAEREQGLMFLDDDLLTALLRCGEFFRENEASLAAKLLAFAESLDDEGPYLPPLIEKFRCETSR
ncbi:contact-dependent growth inhibition system immunity protein [Streptomyces sp. HUAS MG91]|uniref:Contact-dependent growth inhibition system immunity protein n=1 Tax=Streptomyces tabacisoli TaxID=3156398 RepID=A0AAU8IYF3_9ACTN